MNFYDAEYYKKTGRDPNLIIRHIESRYFDKYSKIVEKYDQIEIIDEACDAVGNRLPFMKAIVFTDHYDSDLLMKFYAESYILDSNIRLIQMDEKKILWEENNNEK